MLLAQPIEERPVAPSTESVRASANRWCQLDIFLAQLKFLQHHSPNHPGHCSSSLLDALEMYSVTKGTASLIRGATVKSLQIVSRRYSPETLQVEVENMPIFSNSHEKVSGCITLSKNGYLSISTSDRPLTLQIGDWKLNIPAYDSQSNRLALACIESLDDISSKPAGIFYCRLKDHEGQSQQGILVHSCLLPIETQLEPSSVSKFEGFLSLPYRISSPPCVVGECYYLGISHSPRPTPLSLCLPRGEECLVQGPSSRCAITKDGLVKYERLSSTCLSSFVFPMKIESPRLEVPSLNQPDPVITRSLLVGPFGNIYAKHEASGSGHIRYSSLTSPDVLSAKLSDRKRDTMNEIFLQLTSMSRLAALCKKDIEDTAPVFTNTTNKTLQKELGPELDEAMKAATLWRLFETICATRRLGVPFPNPLKILIAYQEDYLLSNGREVLGRAYRESSRIELPWNGLDLETFIHEIGHVGEGNVTFLKKRPFEGTWKRVNPFASVNCSKKALSQASTRQRACLMFKRITFHVRRQVQKGLFTTSKTDVVIEDIADALMQSYLFPDAVRSRLNGSDPIDANIVRGKLLLLFRYGLMTTEHLGLLLGTTPSHPGLLAKLVDFFQKLT